MGQKVFKQLRNGRNWIEPLKIESKHTKMNRNHKNQSKGNGSYEVAGSTTGSALPEMSSLDNRKFSSGSGSHPLQRWLKEVVMQGLQHQFFPTISQIGNLPGPSNESASAGSSGTASSASSYLDVQHELVSTAVQRQTLKWVAFG